MPFLPRYDVISERAHADNRRRVAEHLTDATEEIEGRDARPPAS
jgi:hypothetical protein